MQGEREVLAECSNAAHRLIFYYISPVSTLLMYLLAVDKSEKAFVKKI